MRPTLSRLSRQLAAPLTAALSHLAPTPHELAQRNPLAAAWQPDPDDAYCPRCGAPAGPHTVTPDGCPRCIHTKPHYQRLTRLGLYHEPLADWIKQLKFAKQWRWADHLGRLLADRLPPPPPGHKPLVIPIPMHRLRRIHRGFNQAELLAHAVAKRRRWPMLQPLRRTRHTRPQSSLPPSTRLTNLNNATACRPVDLAGHAVYLIDDVKTTGATLNTAARLLKHANAPLIHAAVLAIADPTGQRFETITPPATPTTNREILKPHPSNLKPQ
ncbi:MAG: ComF family protein [Planctomycetota bacterium]